MKPRNVGGVVDSQLNVYGVQHLKVADMSIAPGNVGSVSAPDTFSCCFGPLIMSSYHRTLTQLLLRSGRKLR